MAAKVIALFNHKGGVSKTTTTFNLGWSLANLGYKTLIVDADPQCNLTAYCLGLDSQNKLDLFYEKKENDDIFAALEDVIYNHENKGMRPVKPTKTLHKGLELAAGNLGMTDLDIFCANGLTSGNRFSSLYTQFIGLFNAMIRKTAERESFDVVLVDMSPSSGAFNRSILMGSDYFIVPTYPEFFNLQAIEYLAKQIPLWADDFAPYRDPKTPNSLPRDNPKMMGVICQKYRPHRNEKQDKVKAAQNWMNKIQEASKAILAESLMKNNKRMTISEDVFNDATNGKKAYNLIEIPDFNSLILKSQEHNKPVFELTEAEINQTGAVLDQAQENQEIFKNLFNELALSVAKISQLEKNSERS
jgi:chromosome partitioning protein